MNVVLLGLAVAVGLAVVVSVRANLRRLTVFEFERGLRYVRGRFVGVVQPGQYWTWAPTTFVRKLDMRTHVVPVAGQEVLSADGVAIKMSLAATYRIVDPMRAVNAVENYETALYTALQLALRSAVSTRPAEDVLQHRASLGAEILQHASAGVRELGLELLEADLKDLTLPGELKKIFAQVVRARQEGLAALEKARGETAALRSLANAAHMIERNPNLMHLRLLQVLGERSGNTVVLGVPSAAGPIPVRGGDQPPTLPDVSDTTEG